MRRLRAYFANSRTGVATALYFEPIPNSSDSWQCNLAPPTLFLAQDRGEGGSSCLPNRLLSTVPLLFGWKTASILGRMSTRRKNRTPTKPISGCSARNGSSLRKRRHKADDYTQNPSITCSRVGRDRGGLAEKHGKPFHVPSRFTDRRMLWPRGLGLHLPGGSPPPKS